MVAVSELARSRAQAKAENSKFYFTGKPCKRDHISVRYAYGGCVECAKIDSKEWASNNRDKRREIDRAYAARNPEKMHLKNTSEKKRSYNRKNSKEYHAKNHAKRLASMAEWRKNNKQKARAATDRWAAANPERVLANVLSNRARQKENGYPVARKWNANNHEKTALSARKRRVRKLAAPGSHTTAELTALRKKTGNRCASCGLEKKLTVDHIIPLTKGGSDFIRNIQFLCQPCNSAKHNKDPIDFNRSRGLLL